MGFLQKSRVSKSGHSIIEDEDSGGKSKVSFMETGKSGKIVETFKEKLADK